MKRGGQRRKFTKNEKRTYAIAQKAITDRQKKETELKWYDVVSAALSVSNAGAILSLTGGIVKGTDESQRVGDDITVKSILVRYVISGSSTDGSNIVRVMIFVWKRPLSPTASDVLQDIVTLGYLSPINQDETDYVRVLHNKWYTVDTDDPTNNVTDWYKRGTFKVKYQTGSNSNDHGNIYMLLISDSAVVLHPTMDICARIRYIDF